MPYAKHHLWRAGKMRPHQAERDITDVHDPRHRLHPCALGGVVVAPATLNYLWLSNVADFLVRIAIWPTMFLCLALALACIYRFGPSRQTPRWR